MEAMAIQYSKKDLTGSVGFDGFSAILLPYDRARRNEWFWVKFDDEPASKITVNSKVFASACILSNADQTTPEVAGQQVYTTNIVPKRGEVWIRVGIGSGPAWYRVHILVIY